MYAKLIRLTAQSNWADIFPQAGLSEVRFYQIPIKAREPSPAAMYINGEPVGGNQPFTFGPKKDAALVFGCCEANGGNPFNGALDEVRIYDTVLTDAEVRALAGK